MKIDNSQMKAFHRCPWYWAERYGNNLEKIFRTSDALAFGKRMHQLWEYRLRQMKGENVTAPACDAPFGDLDGAGWSSVVTPGTP